MLLTVFLMMSNKNEENRKRAFNVFLGVDLVKKGLLIISIIFIYYCYHKNIIVAKFLCANYYTG